MWTQKHSANIRGFEYWKRCISGDWRRNHKQAKSSRRTRNSRFRHIDYISDTISFEASWDCICKGQRRSENLVCRIIGKNGVMRLGLQVSGPLYQPTHQTAIFLRVTNLTEYIILHKDFIIAQITFEKVATPTLLMMKRKKCSIKTNLHL